MTFLLTLYQWDRANGFPDPNGVSLDIIFNTILMLDNRFGGRSWESYFTGLEML